MKQTKLLAAVALMLPAMAHGQGFFVGFDVGDARSDAKIDEHDFLGATTARSNGSDTGFRLRGGFQIGRFFALEAAYVDFGETESHFEPDDCPNGAPGPCPFGVRTSISGIMFSAVGVLPIGEHWYLDGRLGWGKLDVDAHEIGGAGLDANIENPAFSYGIGGGYRFNEHWGVALDYSEYNQQDIFEDTLEGDFGSYNLGETTLTSLGVSYRF
jgi:OOP family OmpA-OmpF porin